MLHFTGRFDMVNHGSVLVAEAIRLESPVTSKCAEDWCNVFIIYGMLRHPTGCPCACFVWWWFYGATHCNESCLQLLSFEKEIDRISVVRFRLHAGTSSDPFLSEVFTSRLLNAMTARRLKWYVGDTPWRGFINITYNLRTPGIYSFAVQWIMDGSSEEKWPIENWATTSIGM